MTTDAGNYSRLEGRVDNLDRSIGDIGKTLDKLAEKLDSNGPGVTKLEGRVDGIEKSLHDVSAAINGLGSKLDATGRTPWTMIWTALGVCSAIMVSIGTLAYRPIDAAVTRLETRQGVIEEKIVPRQEHTDKWAQQSANGLRLQNNIDRNQDEVVRRLERLEDKRK